MVIAELCEHPGAEDRSLLRLDTYVQLRPFEIAAQVRDRSTVRLLVGR